jgi:ACS family hexuronate transporter-like MFS transporter
MSVEATMHESSEKQALSEISRLRAWLVAIVATLVMSVSYIDRQILAALAKSVREDLVIDPTQFGWLAAAFSIAYLVAAPLSGIVVDKFGARASLVVAMLVWSIVSASHAIVGGFWMLFALRILLGTAEAPSFPAAAQSIRRILPAQDRSAGYGLLFTGSSIGAMIAAPLAIAIKAKYGWRTSFLVGSTVGLLWLPLWIFATHQDHIRKRLATPDSDELAKEELAKKNAPPKSALLKDPAVHRALWLVVMSAPSVMLILIWFPQVLESAFGVAENDIGHYAWLPPIFFDAGAVVFGLIASRRHRESKSPEKSGISSHADLMLVGGLLASTIAFLPLLHTPWAAVFLASASLAGGGALFARLTADMIARVDAAHVSLAGGLTAAAQSLAYVIGNPLVGASFKHTHHFTSAAIVIGCLAFPGALVWVLWPMKKTKITSSA